MSMALEPVPETYRGLWQRTLLRTADGVEDRATRVFWLQTDHLHADIRVPFPYPRKEAARVAMAGFAGITQVRGDRCQWHRLIDFHPDSSVDVGLMQFVDANEVHERAPDNSYLEVWKRLPGSIGAVRAQWLQSADRPERHACLLTAGDFFLFAADRPAPLSPGPSLEERLAGAGPERCGPLLSFELSLGRITGDRQPWQIHLSTLPRRIGQTLVAVGADDDPARWPPVLWQGLGGCPPVAGWNPVPMPSLTFSEEEIPV